MARPFSPSATVSNTRTREEGFSREEADAVCFLLEKLDCGLSMDLHYDYDWCLSLLVYSRPLVSDRAFFLHRRNGEIHLADVTDDEFISIGTFASFIGAITCIQQRVNGMSRLAATSFAPGTTWDASTVAPDSPVSLH
jgi:hypothetical protein